MPFLEAHAQLTPEETQILEEFKAKNPIRTAETLQEIAAEKPAASPLGLEVGDVIRYDGKRREIEEIDDRHITMKDLDAPDFGGVILGQSDELVYDGWQQDMLTKGFEILYRASQKAELQSNVREWYLHTFPQTTSERYCSRCCFFRFVRKKIHRDLRDPRHRGFCDP